MGTCSYIERMLDAGHGPCLVHLLRDSRRGRTMSVSRARELSLWTADDEHRYKEIRHLLVNVTQSWFQEAIRLGSAPWDWLGHFDLSTVLHRALLGHEDARERLVTMILDTLVADGAGI